MSATPAAPVASKSVEDCMRLADRYKAFIGEAMDPARAALQAAIVAYGDAQWNDALAAVKDAVLDDPDADPLHIIAGLKREPR